MTDITEEVERIRAPAEKATPGIWKPDHDCENQAVIGPKGFMVADCAIFSLRKGAPTNADCTANGTYIAAAHPAAILRLISALSTQQAALEAVTAERDEARGNHALAHSLKHNALDRADIMEARALTAESVLTAAKQEQQWRTMESAPRDGTPILGFFPTHYQNSGGQHVCLFYAGAFKILSTPIRDNPTHWRPLPAPPQADMTEE